MFMQVEKKEFPSEEDYCVRLHVVDDNMLECSFFSSALVCARLRFIWVVDSRSRLPPFRVLPDSTNEVIVRWRRPPIFVVAVVGRGVVRARRRGALGLRRSRGGHGCLGSI